MAKDKTKEIENQEEEVGPESQALAYLKANKADHYNFEEDNYYKVPSSSLSLNLELGGGLPVGAHRAIGITSGGKTSCSLDLMFNFLKLGKDKRGVYFKCEGRLSPEMQARSGIKFTTDPTEWSTGTCLIMETNVYEMVFGFMRELIVNNPNKNKYFFIIDSVDSMAKRDDLAKSFEDSAQVAGGALITSVFMKKTANALAKRGHIAIFISQVRDEIKINQYVQTTPRQGKSSGGHALEHGANFVLDFQPRWNDDIIRENPSDKNSKIVGHRCKIKIIKSDNEKNGVELSYPIKYGRTGGKSVWKEYECVDMLLMWSQLKRKGDKGAWFNLDESIFKELKEINKECPEKFQGLDNVRLFLEENPNITDYLYKKYSDVLMNK